MPDFRPEGREQPPAIGPDGPREGGACRLGGREPVILGPARLAVLSCRGADRAPPLRGDEGKPIEGVPHRFANHLKPVQGSHGRQDMGGVGALFAPPFEQTPFLEIRQHGLEQRMFNPASYEARTELTQDQIIEAGVGQFKPEGIFPIDATAYGISRCAFCASGLASSVPMYVPLLSGALGDTRKYTK